MRTLREEMCIRDSKGEVSEHAPITITDQIRSVSGIFHPSIAMESLDVYKRQL